jgi:hypothetical protein
MWIQLLRSQQVEKNGKSRTYYPGDWVDVGKQTALRWIADGAARSGKPLAIDNIISGCGVVVLGDAGYAGKLEGVAPGLAMTQADAPDLPYARTLLWQTSFSLRPELVPLGFKLLEAWEVAAPIVSYDELAIHVGTSEARERTQAVVRDLRVPLYEPRLLFVKRCRAGRELLDCWAAERASGDDDRLCLLRALYQVKPLLCALPITWSKSVPAIT